MIEREISTLGPFTDDLATKRLDGSLEELENRLLTQLSKEDRKNTQLVISQIERWRSLLEMQKAFFDKKTEGR